MLFRDWAQQQGLSRKQIGDRLRISEPHVWRLLRGDGFPKPAVRRAIHDMTDGAVDANALAAAQDEFLGLAPLNGRESNGRQIGHSMD